MPILQRNADHKSDEKFCFVTGPLEFPGRSRAKADRNVGGTGQPDRDLGVTHGSEIEMIPRGIGVLKGQQDTKRLG